MKVILMLRSGVLKRVLSFLREKVGRPQDPAASSHGKKAPPTLLAIRTGVPAIEAEPPAAHLHPIPDQIASAGVEAPQTAQAVPSGAPAVEVESSTSTQPIPHGVPSVEVGEQALRPTRRNERTIVVGIDFGTSTTKVIWQDLSDNHFEVIQWHPASEGLRSFLLPSTVLLRDNSIRFGTSGAEVREGDVWLHSIKLCVLCRRRPTICRCGNPVAREGMMYLPGFGDAIPASSFACLFLAHVFREVEERLVTQFSDDALALIWNVGCPMDHLDVADIRSEWERMAGAAIELRGEALNPAETSLLVEATRTHERLNVAAQSERNYFVQPEGLAAVKAFLESPHADAKTYAIVDVGAGTTEVSFFFNGRAMSEVGQPFRPSYLSDSTEPVGSGQIDLELARSWGCCVEEARKRKEAGPSSIPMVGAVEEICRQYQRTCHEILSQNKLTSPYDKRFDLFVIGGGGRLRPLQIALQSRELFGGFVRERSQQLMPPRGLKNRAELQKNYDFLANACGLASSLDWDHYPPKDVGSMPMRPTRPRPDPIEI